MFVLISGYFLIRLRPKTLITIALIVWVYELVSIAGAHLMGITLDSKRIIYALIDPLGNSRYWFISYYFGLVLISPLLNKFLESATINQLRKYILLLFIFNTYSCAFLSNPLDHGGYSLFNFICLYCIGYYLQKEQFIDKISRTKLLVCFFICVGVNTLLASYMIKGNPEISLMTLSMTIAGKYSNPFVILSAAVILLLFRSLKFHSSGINAVASSALGVYLLQDGVLGVQIYKYQKEIVSSGNIVEYCEISVVLFFICWLVSFVIMLPLRQLADWISKQLTMRIRKIELRF